MQLDLEAQTKDNNYAADVEFYEYTSAANPIKASLTPRIPFRTFSAELYESGPTRIVPLDLSAELKCPGPATGPGLCASFIRILADENIPIPTNATSLVFYIIRGRGRAETAQGLVDWNAGDFLTIPGGAPLRIYAEADSALYCVDDTPLLTYLGVKADKPRFGPTLYDADRVNTELALVANDPRAENRSRISVLLGNRNFPLTRTVTHVLWAMYGLVVPGTMQKPHRHQSIALDFIVSCATGCYTLVGKRLGEDGQIIDPDRIDWEPGLAFVTPPGYWHAHFNESDAEARLIPIQDAGLQTYLRTLDIRFS